MSQWSVARARALYNLAEWSEGYFDISESGSVIAQPYRDPAAGQIDLAELTTRVREIGLMPPLLVRFNDILHDRVRRLCQAFDGARARHDFEGGYTAVYPIKVNQQRSVVEQIIASAPGRVGLEAGSKPELMAVLGLAPADGIIICNGYKDRAYIRRALIAKQLGHRAFIVVEKLSELDDIIAESAALQVKPLLGLRVRLASIGKGNWQNTGGEKAKFGLNATQVLQALDRLRANALVDCLELLHFHMGSQIANIRDIQRGIREAARYYQSLYAQQVRLRYLDVGGGLGVDYEGTRTRGPCSMNYTVDEYAHAIVRTIKEACDETGLPHPELITEAGRAMTAHHAVLITQVTDVERPHANGAELREPAGSAPIILQDLWEGLQNIGRRSPIETYHDAVHLVSEAQSMYTHGLLNLAGRAQAEELYTAICLRLRTRLDPAKRPHREVLEQLEERFAVKYFCNFSLFQSLPDIWAIQQIFPILPLRGLDEEPTERGIIQDLTCDSDGRIDRYVDEQGLSATLPLHPLDGRNTYLLGFFLVGAYQEILGDMHNLFGDTDAVNASLRPEGGYTLLDPERGDTADQLLAYVHFQPETLIAEYDAKIARARLPAATAAAYRKELTEGLRGYTYLRKP